MCNAVFSNLNISCCDNLCQAAELLTYCNDALGCSSFIDHFFVSDSIKTCVASVGIIDSGCNLSDHRPIVASFMFTDLHMDNGHKNFPSKAPTLYSWQWDKSDLNYYYDCSRASLGNVTVPSHLVSCVSRCCGQDHSVLINQYYGCILLMRTFIHFIHSYFVVLLVPAWQLCGAVYIVHTIKFFLLTV